MKNNNQVLSQRRKIKVLFNIVKRRIFKLLKFSSLRKIINLISLKAGHILLDERRFLLIIAYLRSEYNFIKNLPAMLQYTDDFNCICMTYRPNFSALNNINE